MAPIIIDDEAKLKVLLTHVKSRMSNEQLVFVDLEDVNLGRHGTVAIMQLLLPPESVVYLVDVHVLGSTAFDITIENDISLRSILESSSIFKVFFDIRNDSDALFAHFDINVAGIIDLQIIEYATRRLRGKFVNGLAKCIERDLSYVPGWSVTKDKGRRLFAPEAGGRYEVFLERPIPADIAKYCEQDVTLMPRLLACYGPKLNFDIATRLQNIVDERISLSKTLNYNGHGPHKAIGPSLDRVVSRTNLQTSPEIEFVCSPRLGQLCRIDDSLLNDLIGQFEVLHVVQEPLMASSKVTPNVEKTIGEKAQSAEKIGSPSVLLEAAVTPESLDGNAMEDDWRERFGDEDIDEDIYGRTGYGDGDDDNDFD